MKRYIKINVNDEIIDLICDNGSEHQKNKYNSGTDIYFDEVQETNHKINGKSRSNENGIPIFTWDGTKAIEKDQSIIDTDPKQIQAAKDDIMKQIQVTNLDMIDGIEDVIKLVNNGTPLPKDLTDIITERENLRSQL